MSFSSASFLAYLDKIRAIPAKLGRHPYRVYIVQVSNTHAEATFGYVTKTSSTTELTVDGYAPHVEQLSQEEIRASGGLYQSQDLKVGPLTPAFNDSSLTDGKVRKFLVTGPGIAANSHYSMISQQHFASSYYLILRKS